jgi:hypothetical protein
MYMNWKISTVVVFNAPKKKIRGGAPEQKWTNIFAAVTSFLVGSSGLAACR